MIEEWKTIEDYPDYQISNLGRVKSFKKYNGTSERILKPGKDNRGYLLIGLFENKIRKTAKIHRLVLTYFKPILNLQDYQCNHIDGNKQNNNIDNLEWCTPLENMKHAIKIGLVNNKGINSPLYGTHPSEETKRKLSDNHKDVNGENNPNYGKHHSEETKRKISKNHGDVKGEKSPNHKLTEKEVIDIRELLSIKISQVKIAKKYNVTQSHISRIKLGKVWRLI